MHNDLHETYFGHKHVVVIEPPSGWRLLNLRELWAYRELLWVLALRDIRVRYKQTVLGVAWAIIQPITTMIIFSVVFGRLAGISSEGFPYPVFVYAALLPWTFFANTVNASAVSVVGSVTLISRVYFPRLIVPLSSFGAGLFDFAISVGILLLLMLIYQIPLTWNLIAVPILIAAVVFTALGIGTLLSALTVFYRDFRHVVPFTIQIWLYVTPVVYPTTLVPENWRWLLFLNPMAGLVDGFRSAFLGKPFDFAAIALSFLVAIALFLAAMAYFERVERRFADVI